MKKLINLIALVMLVSTNVLTPFSYAQVEIPEVIPENEVETVSEIPGETGENSEISEENSELAPNGTLGLEQNNQDDKTPENVLPDIQDDIETPIIDETENADTEKDEGDEIAQQLGEIPKTEVQDEDLEGVEDGGFLLQKEGEPIIMNTIPNTSVTLLPGTGFNSEIKTLANGGVDTEYTSVDNNIQGFQRVDVKPTGVTIREISLAGEGYPVYAWFDEGIIYYTSEAKTLYLNPDSSHMFASLLGLTELELSNWNASNIINMNNMFYDDHELNDLDLSGWDTSNVTSMSNMFNGCDNLTEVNMSGWNFSNLSNISVPNGLGYSIGLRMDSLKELDLTNAVFSGYMGHLFGYVQNLENLKLDGINTTNVTNMDSMFDGCNSLTGLDLSSFDTSNVTNMSNIFNGCTSIQTLILDNWDFSKNPSRGGMFNGTTGLETLSAKNWIIPETFTQAFGCTNAMLCAKNVIIDVSNWDLTKTDSLKQLFFISYAKEIKGLDTRDTSRITNMNGMFRRSSLTKLDLSHWNTSNVTDMSQMFYECHDLEEINVNGWDTSNVNNMYEMFRDCDKLEELDLRHFDVSNATNMREMFQDCDNLKFLNLEGRDIGNMIRWNIGNIIHYCNNLEELNLSGWDFRNIGGAELFYNNLSSYQLSKVKKLNLTNAKFSGSMERTFSGIPNVEEIKWEGIDTSKVTSMSNMFAGCSKLIGLDLSNWDTSNVSSVDNMFTYCSNLQEVNMSGWDFRNAPANNLFVQYGNVTGIKYVDMTNAKFSGSLNYIFGQIKSVENIKLDGVDTSNVTYMTSMFNGCSKLTGLDLSSFDTSNVRDLGSMFYGCSGLQKLDLSNRNTSNVTNFGGMFGYCNNLEEINLSGWDFNNYKPYGGGLFMSMTAGGILKLKKLNMRNTKFSGSMASTFYGLTGLQEIGLEGADTSNVTNMSSMFNGCSSLKNLDLSSFDTSNVTGMNAIFNGCSKLENLNLDNWNFSSMTGIGGGMFNGTNSLKTLSAKNWTIPETFTNAMGCRTSQLCTQNIEINVSNWNLSRTKNLDGLFGSSYAKEIKGLDTWDTSGVIIMSNMFNSCYNLTGLDLSSWNTSNVTGMQAMFARSNKLENLNLDNWIISGSSSTIGGMFGGANNLKSVSMRNWVIPETFIGAVGCRTSSLCATGIESVDVSNWDLSNTKNLSGLFGDLKAREIKGLNTWDTNGVTDMQNIFWGCSNITGFDLSNWNTSNVTNMGSMFSYCSKLTGLNLSNFDTSNVTNFGGIFGYCNNLEEINLSGRDFRNYNNSNMMMNIMWGTPQSLKKLDMTNTKYTGNAVYAFGGLTKLEELNLDGVDTKGVTGMQAMFNGDINLKNLNLSDFDTSNVKDMVSMFYNCSSLDELNLSNWDTSNVISMGAMFYNCSSLDELDLSNWDTSNVTSIGAMFYNCSGLNEIDLTNFDTSKVTAMGQMFFNTPNLKTIYASDKFVTTALSGDNPSKDMFSGTTSVIGGNGTKFDPNYIDEEYAKIDKVGQTGYFTDKNAINVKFISTLDGTETLATFAKGQKLTPPYVDKYHVVGGYLDEAMTQKIDLNKGVDSYSEIYVKYDHNGSSGGGGGGGSSKDTDKDTHGSAEDSQKNTQDDKNTENVIQSETKGSEEASNTPVDSSDKSSEGQEILSPSDSSFTKEQKDAYTFAKENGITTKDTIQSAQMNGKLTRIAMAKMLSQYAINVLGQTPDSSKTIKFRDVTSKKDADYDNGVTLAYQLGIMGQNMPGNNFRPNDEVTRAEFATALSRMAYNTSDGEYKSTSKYYIHHMEKLVNEGIITNDNPNMKELRGYVMIMLMRSAK